jgi:hypothetical protein
MPFPNDCLSDAPSMLVLKRKVARIAGHLAGIKGLTEKLKRRTTGD